MSAPKTRARALLTPRKSICAACHYKGPFGVLWPEAGEWTGTRPLRDYTVMRVEVLVCPRCGTLRAPALIDAEATT